MLRHAGRALGSASRLYRAMGLWLMLSTAMGRDLGLDCLGQQCTRPITQDFGELIVDVSWLNQLDDVISGHGISLLRWRSGGVKHPHDMPPSRFPPSPTFSDSSLTNLSTDLERPLQLLMIEAINDLLGKHARPKVAAGPDAST